MASCLPPPKPAGVKLIPHPASFPVAVSAVEAEAAISGYRQLVLRFQLRGDIDRIAIPPAGRYAERRDGLWQTTCFEAFVRGADDRYVELNLSPSTAWAAYTFESYRGEPGLPAIDALPIDVERGGDVLRVAAAVDLSGIGLLDGHEVWMVNLTAVIEETDGTKSYWALRHPSERPDFHHADGFVLGLAAQD